MLPIYGKCHIEGPVLVMQKGKKHYDAYRRIRADSGQQRRIRIAMAVLGAAAFLPVLCQLYSLMVTHYDTYSALALSNQSRTTQVSAARGTIYDRNMNILAASKTVETVYIDPRELKQSKADIPSMARFLGELLEVDPARIEKLAADSSKRYHMIKDRVEEDTAAQIRDYINSIDLQGLHLEPSSQRYYPFGTLAAQVIGFTNASNNGAEGVEASYEAYLSADPGKVITTKGNNEMDMPFSVERYFTGDSGNDLVLTIDTTVQSCLEQRMQQACDAYDVQNGAFGLVMDVNTGEILAMATLGSYDPNNYLEITDEETARDLEKLRLNYLSLNPESEQYTQAKQTYRQTLVEARLKQWRNRCLSDGYEPGSTFKTITLAAAIDCGAVTLNDHFSCSGAEQIPGRSQLLHCWRTIGHGGQTTAQALQNSCNLAFAHIGLKLGGERFYDYVKNFGILEKTGIDLAGESAGVFFSRELIVDTDKWGTASLTSGSFGQTFKITPLQLVRAIAAVVNGGYLLEPYIVDQVMDANGNTLLKQEPTVIRQVISNETSQTMRTMIESVVTEGTAKNASVAGYRIGGKTGTSEKIDVFDENGQRVQDKIVSFVGIAPMDDPRYIILVALDTPSRETGIYISGGVMAAPTVGAVLEDILPYLEVERIHDQSDPAAQRVEMPDVTNLNAGQAQSLLESSTLTPVFTGEGDIVTGQLPMAGQVLTGGSQVMLYLGQPAPTEPVTVPDFIGMTASQAEETAAALGLFIQTSGNPDSGEAIKVSVQEPAAGSKLEPGSIIKLTFTDPRLRD